MFVLRASRRDRYTRALCHMLAHPEWYEVISRGRDYGATTKDRAAGCGWYIQYRRLPA